MTGCTETEFCPDVPLTRAQAAVVLAKAIRAIGNGYTVYEDVPVDHWAAPSISALHNQGDIGGCSADEFCLDAPMRRWIFMIWLVNVKDLPKFTCP